MSGKPLVLGVCALLVSLGAAGQVNTKVKPSQHTPFPTSKSSTTGLIFNRVLKSTSISWGEPMVFEAAGNADIDPGLDFTCVGPTTCTLSAEIKVQVAGVVSGQSRGTLRSGRWSVHGRTGILSVSRRSERRRYLSRIRLDREYEQGCARKAHAPIPNLFQLRSRFV